MFLRLYTLLATYASIQDGGHSTTEVSPVKLTVFYETRCPDCINFFKDQLQPAYEKLSNITEIEIYAYGKIQESGGHNDEPYQFECQHGPKECYGNKVLECGKKYVKDFEAFLNFVFCIMGSEDPPHSGQKCSAKLGIPFGPIERCSNSTEGDEALHQAGLVQKKLASNLYVVPWIMINGKFSEETFSEAINDLPDLICKTYKGKLPESCLH